MTANEGITSLYLTTIIGTRRSDPGRILAVDCLLPGLSEGLLTRILTLKLDESAAITGSHSANRLVWITCHK
jgi:hypothetical protein